jgi:predicted GIY-YIG superfamily endonuclease
MSEWYCYILRNTHPKYRTLTYNGSTNDPLRRLRQHNEEIVGGAKATHGKGQSWEIYALMTGFKDHINTLSCEWRIKHPSGKPGKREPRFCGVYGRILSLNEILSLPQWTKQCVIPNSECQYTLYVTEDVVHLIDRTIVPDNITVRSVPCIKTLIQNGFTDPVTPV